MYIPCFDDQIMEIKIAAILPIHIAFYLATLLLAVLLMD